MEGQDSVLSVLGPLANSLSGIKLFMQAVSAYKPWLDQCFKRCPLTRSDDTKEIVRCCYGQAKSGSEKTAW